MESKAVVLIALTVLSTVGLAILYVFTGLAGAGVGPFNHTISELSGMYETDITPASYTFMIWNLIFVWQAVWIIYALSAICRKNESGPVFLNPVVMPASFYVFWLVAIVFYIAWLFTWDREQLLVSFVMLLLLTLAGYTATAFQGIATADNAERVVIESKRELVLVYVIVQNGIDLFFAWTTVATMVNLSIALTYDESISNLSRQTSSIVALSILLVLVVGWSVVENTVFFKFFKYVYAWYGVLVWASAGILVKNYEPSSTATILNIVVLAVAIVCLGLKIGIYLYRTRSSARKLFSPLPP